MTFGLGSRGLGVTCLLLTCHVAFRKLLLLLFLPI